MADKTFTVRADGAVETADTFSEYRHTFPVRAAALTPDLIQEYGLAEPLRVFGAELARQKGVAAVAIHSVGVTFLLTKDATR
jgi:hypothetical protein